MKKLLLEHRLTQTTLECIKSRGFSQGKRVHLKDLWYRDEQTLIIVSVRDHEHVYLSRFLFLMFHKLLVLTPNVDSCSSNHCLIDDVATLEIMSLYGLVEQKL